MRARGTGSVYQRSGRKPWLDQVLRPERQASLGLLVRTPEGRVCLRAILGAYRTISDARLFAISNAQASLAPSLWSSWGHKTESVYQRYGIVAELDLTDGVRVYASRLDTQRVEGVRFDA